MKHGDRGQSLVELCLVTPILLALMVGIVETGRYAYYAIQVHNAARAGVAYGAQNSVTALDTAGVKAAALADAANVSPAPTVSPSYFCTCADGTSSTCKTTDCSGSHMIVYVQVVTSETFHSLFNYPGIRSTLSVTGKAVMRVSQ